MNLDLGHIEERETFSFQERFTVPTQEDGASECDTTVTGTIVRTGSRLLLDAHITGEVHVACDRCLSEYNLPIDTDFNLVFHRGTRSRVPEGIEEDDFILLTEVNEQGYDIFPRVREEVILELPIKFLCSATCKGLCSKCGANLNERDCGCNREGGDPRWESLKKLLSGEGDH